MLQLLNEIQTPSLLKAWLVSASRWYRFQLMVKKGQHPTLPVQCETQFRYKGMLSSKILVNGGILTPPLLVSSGDNVGLPCDTALCIKRKKKKHVTLNIYKPNVSGSIFFLVTA